MSWADDLAAARVELHTFFGRAASYQAPGAATPIAVSVRVHDKTLIKGDINGFGYGEKALDVPQVVFLAAELASPVRGSRVTLTTGEVYQIDTVLPQHGVTIPCDASRID